MRRAPVLLSLVAVALVGLLAVGRSGLGAVAQGGTPSAGDQGLVGSWVITAQLEGDEPLAFVNFATIMPGGVLIATAPDSPLGHGAWERAGDGDYALTIVFPDFDDEGDLEGRITVRATVTLGRDGDTFAGPFVTEVADLAGEVLFSYGGAAEAVLIAVEPLGTPVAGATEAATPTP